MPDASHVDDNTLVLDAVDKFLERDVAPYVREFEAADKYPQEIADKLAELGLMGRRSRRSMAGLAWTLLRIRKSLNGWHAFGCRSQAFSIRT